jgi:hypothetical protein
MPTETKLFEIRDDGTHIPAVAVKLTPSSNDWDYPIRRAGFTTHPGVMLAKIATNGSSIDPYGWKGCRTMTTAHVYIENNWDTLKTGDVIDVEFVAGIRTVPKRSERYGDGEASWMIPPRELPATKGSA